MLSVLVALILSPALTSTLLRRKGEGDDGLHWLDRRAPALGNAHPQRAGTRSTAGSSRLVDRLSRRRSSRWSTASGCSSAIYGLVVVALILMFLRLPTGFLPTEDQGAASIQLRLPAGRDADAHARSARRRSRSISLQEREQERPTLFRVAGGGGGGGAVGQNTGPGLRQPQAVGRAAGQGEYRRCDRRARVRARSAACATRRSSRSCPARSAASASRRLHHGAAEPQRHEPRAVRRRARPAAGSGECQSEAGGGPPERPARRRDAQDRRRTAEADRARPQPERRQHHAVDRLGRALRQRLHRQGPRQARLRPGRRAVSRRPDEPRPMVRPLVERRDGAVLRLRAGRLGDRAEQPVALPGRACRSNSRDRRRRASARARRWTKWSSSRARFPAPASPGRAVLPGAAVLGPGAAALRDLAAGRLPVPRRALRKLVDPGRGAAGRPARPRRRDLRGHPARARERRLPADRPADDDGPRRRRTRS